jgi:hypothetical protein
MLVPKEPGIFSVAEETPAPGSDGWPRRYTLAVTRVEAAGDLFHALNQLFDAGSAMRERLVSHRCFLRYAVVPDADQRACAVKTLQAWLDGSGPGECTVVHEFIEQRPASDYTRSRE